jgi:hypothetical protein
MLAEASIGARLAGGAGVWRSVHAKRDSTTGAALTLTQR